MRHGTGDTRVDMWTSDKLPCPALFLVKARLRRAISGLGLLPTGEYNRAMTISSPLNSEPHLPLGRYRHYKGLDYEVLGVAQHSETGESLVIYRCLYGDFSLWARPRAMFQESVELAGEQIPRFVYLGTTLPREIEG